MPAAKDWSPEGIHSWVNEFIESTGRAPTLRDMDKDGPNRRNRTKYGGIIGILAVAGISATTYGVHRYRSKQGLIQEVRMWSEQHLPPDRQLKQLDLHVARLNGHLSFHPDTIGNHFDSWKQFLTEAGFARQEWAPAECVQFGRTLIETYSHSKLEKLIDRYGVTGRTPDFDTFKAYYPDIKKFMFERVKWENWHVGLDMLL